METERVGDLCTVYCDAVQANCTGEQQQYASAVTCMTVCEVLEAGELGDTGVNTVECRLARAELARATGEPVNYCASAGPGGAGACGNNCAAYCDLMGDACPEQLGDRDACLDACNAVPVAQGRFNTAYDVGNTLQCRLFHVSAATLDPVTHCNHAAGGAVCVGTAPQL
jgi:hypothetical protein